MEKIEKNIKNVSNEATDSEKYKKNITIDYKRYEEIANDPSLNFYTSIRNKKYTWQVFEKLVVFENENDLDHNVSALVAIKLLRDPIFKLNWYNPKSIESKNDQFTDILTNCYLSALRYIERWDPTSGIYFSTYFQKEMMSICFKNVNKEAKIQYVYNNDPECTDFDEFIQSQSVDQQDTEITYDSGINDFTELVEKDKYVVAFVHKFLGGIDNWSEKDIENTISVISKKKEEYINLAS